MGTIVVDSERVLVVVREFFDYARGTIIRDADRIAEMLASEYRHHVVPAIHAAQAAADKAVGDQPAA